MYNWCILLRYDNFFLFDIISYCQAYSDLYQYDNPNIIYCNCDERHNNIIVSI